jgi:hypothetical protein
MKKLYLATIVLIAAMFLSLSTAAQANLLNNPGFNDGAAWWSTSGGYYVETWGGIGDTKALFSWTGTGEAYQEVSGITGSTPYTFSVYGMADAVSPGAYLKLAWYNDSNLITTDPLDVTLPHQWDWASAANPILDATSPPSANKVRVIIGGTSTVLNRWDNADFSPVPEPASLLLLGSGLIGLFGLRKRTKK